MPSKEIVISIVSSFCLILIAIIIIAIYYTSLDSNSTTTPSSKTSPSTPIQSPSTSIPSTSIPSTSQGTVKTICKADGTWSADTAEIGGKITKKCTNGNTSTATCKTDGTWDISQCACITDGSWSGDSIVNYGQKVTKKCPSGGNQTATCKEDGVWDISECPPIMANKTVFRLKYNTTYWSNNTIMYSIGETISSVTSGEIPKPKTNEIIINSSNINSFTEYTFSKEGCLDNNSVINYGDKVQLKINKPIVYPTYKYAQCGGGTCSMVEDSGNCDPINWQTFTIISGTDANKKGPVYIGDLVRITQTVGKKCSIRVAGGGNTFCSDDPNDENTLIQIIPTDKNTTTDSF